VTGSADGYEVYALRYALMRDRRASELYAHYHSYGLEDRSLDMACYFWLIRNGSHVVLVDCGWNRERGLVGARYRRVGIEQHDPLELLRRLDVDPRHVDHVIVSHMHLDHIGNLDLFPNATFSVARAEFDCWTGAYGARPALAHATSAQDVRVLQELERDGRVRLIDAAEQLLPGITATPVGGHSPGQLVIETRARSGAVMLASDAVHYHDEIEHDRPFYVYTDLLAMFAAYDWLRQRTASSDCWLVTGHDPVEMNRFRLVNPDTADLTQPLS
jgi:glyoxylase-like metal-dependent hydrolase (beta-lactamase superfamily II)